MQARNSFVVLPQFLQTMVQPQVLNSGMQNQVNRPQMVKLPFLLPAPPGVQMEQIQQSTDAISNESMIVDPIQIPIKTEPQTEAKEQIQQSTDAISHESMTVDPIQIPIKSELQTESKEQTQYSTVPFEKMVPFGTTISRVKSEPETQSEDETKFLDKEGSLEVTSTSLLGPPINLSASCRTCFKEIKSCDISSSIKINNEIRQMLLACTDIQLLINKAFPGSMCGDCYKQLQISYEFKCKCDWSQQQFEDKLYSQPQKKQYKKVPFIQVYKPIDGDDSQNIFIQENSDTVKNVDKGICPVGTKFYGYKCNLCDKVSESKKKLRIHKHVHREKEKHLCSYCGKMLGDKRGLIIHENIHQKERLSCGLCSRTFVHSHYFERHQQFHANPNPYLCAICGKQFPVKCLLRRHVENHSSSKEKKIKCNVVSCGKTFRSKQSLRYHVKTHKGERNHECSICHKNFYEKIKLKNHLVVHSDEKPHACKVCSFRTKHKVALSTHMKLVHKLIKSA